MPGDGTAIQHHAPCGTCPFLRAKAGMLRGERAAEIADALRSNAGHFWCHKTVDYSKGRGGRPTAESRLCAGSLIVADRSDERPTQLARIYTRLGVLDYRKIAASKAPCFDSLDEFIEAHRDASRAEVTQRRAKANP